MVEKIKELKAQLEAAQRISAANMYTADFVRKTQSFERLYNVRACEFDTLVSTLKGEILPSNFGIKITNYSIDDYVVWFLAYVTGAVRSYDALASTLSLTGATIHAEQVRRKVEWVAQFGAKNLKKKFIKFPTKKQMEEESRQILSDNEQLEFLAGKMVFIIDGTGINIYSPGDSRLRRFTWCWYKHKPQIRMQVVCTLSGSAVYVSPYTQGHIGDSEALEEDAKNEKNNFFLFFFTKLPRFKEAK